MITTEAPDFEQIARRLKAFCDDHPQLAEQNHRAVAEQLRQVWEARGNADIGTISRQLPDHILAGCVTAIKRLDR